MAVHILLFFLLMGMCEFTTGTSINEPVCQAWGEPHIQTWSNGDTSRSGLCTSNGRHCLMNNTWISFYIEISSGYTVQATIDFRRGSLNSICNVQWAPDLRLMATTSICTVQGVNITSVQNGSLKSTRIHYNAAGITIIVTHDSGVYRPHLNINIWKPPEQLADGLCTDNQCSAIGRSISSLPPFKISREVAKIICQDYLDGFLEKLSLHPTQRNSKYNETIQMFQESCIFDVALTGQADAATSAIQMLMVQEFSNDVTNVRSGTPKFQSGFLKASRFYEQAKSEAKAKLALKHIL